MKRAVMVWCLGICVSVFFTGCNSLSSSMEVDAREVGTSVAVEEDGTRADDSMRLGYSEGDKNQEPPDYFEQNMQEKFKRLEGKQAFRIKSGHSQEVTDFQIGGLRADRTFIYGYATRLENGSGEMVHCGAFYNYRSGAFSVFHEKTYNEDSLPEGQEAFFLQVCMSPAGEPGDIFVYDNGYGYIYNSSGELKFEVDLDTFVRRQYPDVYSLTIVNAMTDGDNRIYMELSVEKEKLDIPADDDADQEESEEELDSEAEHLEAEIENKVDEVVLVYEFKEIHSDMHQYNNQFWNQRWEWIHMAEGREFTEDPDPYADWNTAVDIYPSSWGGVKLTDLNSLPMYEWKDEEQFLPEEDSDVCAFLAVPDSYRSFTALTGNSPLGKVFYAPDNHYSRIYGRAGRRTTCDTEEFSRTYTYVWEETVTDDQGNTSTVQHSEERTQTIKKDRGRHAPLEQGYTETFWNLDQEKARTLGNSIGSDIICCGKDGKVYWIREGGELEETGSELSEERQVGVIPDGTETCLVASDNEKLYLFSNGIKVVKYSELGDGYRQGSSSYDRKFDELNGEGLPDTVDVYSGSDYYTEKNVLRVDLSVDGELTLRLRAKEPDNGWPEIGGTKKGFLFSSKNQGLIYYDPVRRDSLRLSEGTWYQSFLLGGKCISVGFTDGGSSYSGLDIARARVYEYNLDTLCREMMTEAYNAILEKEEKERQEAASKASSEAAAESSTELEGVEDPMEQWNQDYKEKHQEDN